MASPTEHRTSAETLLERASRHALTDPARLVLLSEAQVHATLYLSDLTAAIAAPVRINLGAEVSEENMKEALARSSQGFAVPQPEPSPKPARRTRKAASAKDDAK
ncbi:hypothetical protein SEA_ADOLIN_54 [Arthrobacter phage Adolin]|uniref:Uncharacterized protein n=1 Tax=Arthrobacter phage Adolin TaxID=2686213 RepID=A0A6B9L5L3_9CAUD|nr:hypothetical protein SEA_ADOLIN_54 [Arthrobacter phage Adolin]